VHSHDETEELEELSLFLPQKLYPQDIISVRTKTDDHIWICQVQKLTELVDKETKISVKWFALQWCFQSTCMYKCVI
jgi:hypothetical protein